MSGRIEGDAVDRGHEFEGTAGDLRVGDVYTDRSGTNWLVREVGPVLEGAVVNVRLSAGRSQPGAWEPFAVIEPVRIWRPFEWRCSACGGLDGAHGLVHRVTASGGRANVPCPEGADDTPCPCGRDHVRTERGYDPDAEVQR